MRGGKEYATMDLYQYIFDGQLADDIRLEEGDVIVVPTYELLVGIDGNVKRPMYYEMKADETLGTLIDYAGGFTGNAYTEEVRLIRETGREHQLFNIPSGKFSSYRLEDGDAVSVGATAPRLIVSPTVSRCAVRFTVRACTNSAEASRQSASWSNGPTA